MSLIRPVLNAYLRTFEKRSLARTTDINAVRRNFERSARWFFRAPRGSERHPLSLDGCCDCLEVTTAQSQTGLVIFYIHGGGFVFGSPETHAAMLAELARRTGARVVMPRYRLAPEHPFPAAVEDVEQAYLALIASGVELSDIVIGGDSAGGTLLFNLLAGIVENDWPRPRGAFGLSPFVDFAHEGESYVINARREAVLPAARASEMVAMYLNGSDSSIPRISPLSADYRGAPPVWICVGDTEILRDDARRMWHLLQDQGVEVVFDEEHDLPHVWPIFHNILPEARQTLDRLADWIKALPSKEAES